MKVLGLLSFFDEEPEHLTATVRSLPVDHLIAVDGAYGLFPDAEASSDPGCHDALRKAASEAGIGLTLHVPAAPYEGNEVEKRSLMFALAHSLAEPHEDWLFVVDADETVVEHGDYREILAEANVDVASILHGEPRVRPRAERRFFRAHPRGIVVKKVHYYYLNGDQDVLWGPQQVDRVMLEQFRVLHEPLKRSKDRNKRRNRYYEDRLITRAEPELCV